LPQVPKIVLREEAFVGAEVKIGKAYLVWVVTKDDATDAAVP
jgi:hypothetical protein